MRVFFSKGAQNKFINKILSRISVKEAAKLCNLSERTIRDWRREKFLVNADTLRKLCRKTKIPFPSNIKLRDNYWYVAHGSSAGGKAVLKKYGRIGGDPEYRKKKWYEWWKKVGRFNPHQYFVTKDIAIPQKSAELAEFVGIMIGDGGITKKQVIVTLNRQTDKLYSIFVENLIEKLFEVRPSIYIKKDALAVSIIVSRKRLVSFCKSIGLKIGNKLKQNLDIPDWIKQNKLYSIACIRGLVDTDGCIFTHRYKVNDKFYSYKKLSFTSYSKPLRRSVFKILKNNGLNPRLSNNRDVRLDSIVDMRKYFEIFSSSNPKHLKRLKN